MDFTQEEIQEEVERLVQSTITTPRDSLGTREVKTTFDQIQQAAAGVFLLYFNAPFYVAFLGSRRLKELVDAEADLLLQIIDNVAIADRVVFPINDLSPLSNAQAALQELGSAVAARSSGFADIEKVPAFRRYAQNVQDFLDNHGRNIKRNGAIVSTPQQARSELPGLLAALAASHLELRRRSELLRSALDDFEALDLPALAAAGVLSKAAAVLEERISGLTAKAPFDRLEDLRQTTLELLAQKAVVQRYGAAQKPSPYFDVEGTVSAFSDADHLSTPAALTADVLGPYNLISTNQELVLELDGGSPFSFFLPLSFIAQLDSRVSEPFVIDATNDKLQLEIESVQYNVTLTHGTRTAAQVVADVNPVIAPTDAVMEQIFRPLKLDTLVDITSLGGSNARFTLLAGSLTSLGIVVGDEVDVLSGANAGTTWTVTAVDVGLGRIDTSGSGPVTPETSQSIQVGDPDRSLSLRDTNPAASLSGRRRIRFVTDLGGPADFGAQVLGFAPELFARSRPSLAADVATTLNLTFSVVRGRTAHQAAFTGRARTVLGDPTRLVVYRFRGTGALTCPSAGNITITGFAGEGSSPEVGDQLVLRSGSLPDTVWTVVTASDSVVTATGSGSPAPATVTFEAGPALGHDFGWSVQGIDGPNSGTYIVAEPPGAIPLEVEVERVPPILAFGDQPITMAATIGQDAPVFESQLAQVSSSVQASGAANPTFFTTSPAVSRGTSPWVVLSDVLPKGLVPSDLLELYETQYNVASRTFVVESTDTELQVLGLDEEIESDASFAFGDGTDAPPFARLRLGGVADYTTFSTALDAWLDRAENQPAFFTDLNRLMNPILVNKNPTAAEVNDAVRHVEKLFAWLTEAGAASFGGLVGGTTEDTLEFAIEEYNVDAVEPVDALLKSFREKSADRAIDLLLEGRFTDFFGTTLETTSYSGSLLSGIRDVAKDDLPIRKYNRNLGFGNRLLAASPDTDYEFNREDGDVDVTPDPPMNADGEV